MSQAALARMLERFSEIAGTVGDARELTEWMLTQVSGMTDWPVAHALLVDPHGAVTLWFSQRNTDTRWEAYILSVGGLAMRTPTGLIDRVLATRRPGWVSDIGTEADYPRAAAARVAGLRGVFAFPVIRADRVVALLQFLSPTPIEPHADFLDAMTIAGRLLGDAVDRLRLHGESADQPSRLHRIVDAGSAAFFATDNDGRITEWAPSAQRLFGWTRTEAMYRRGTDLLLWDDRADGDPGSAPSIPAQSRSDEPALHPHERILRRRDGSAVPVAVTRWQLPVAIGMRTYFFCRDISEARQRATGGAVDPLTGLANRAGFVDALAARLDASSAPGRRGTPTLLLLGLERFKEVDYSVEHRLADEALQIIGRRIVEALAVARDASPAGGEATHPPPQDAPLDPAPDDRATAEAPTTVVGRVAGDEFGILLDTSGAASDIAALAERLIDAITVPFQVGGRRLALTAHVGAAAPLPGGDVASWFGDADAALYRSRHPREQDRHLGARFEIEGFARRQGGSWRQNLPAEMRAALHDNQFELHCQPVVALPSRTITGAEALIRWHHPQHGLLFPGAFIDAAEESGMIAPIGEWVMQTSARQAATWRAAGLDLSVAVNLCARQLADPGIIAQVANAVDTVGASGGGLVVEMTESVLMVDPAVAATRIGQFRDMGVAVSIDDFGTGYSSLAYLKWFDVDIIKIDMSFVRGMSTSRTDTAIVRTIVELGRELGMDVVAEGVETEDELNLLIGLGCNYVQGFYLGRPAPVDAFTGLLVD